MIQRKHEYSFQATKDADIENNAVEQPSLQAAIDYIKNTDEGSLYALFLFQGNKDNYPLKIQLHVNEVKNKTEQQILDILDQIAEEIIQNLPLRQN